MILMLLAHLSMSDAGWSALRGNLAIMALGVLTAGPAIAMLRHGPGRRFTLPDAAWTQLDDSAAPMPTPAPAPATPSR
jgi:hypothetical protein